MRQYGLTQVDVLLLSSPSPVPLEKSLFKNSIDLEAGGPLARSAPQALRPER